MNVKQHTESQDINGSTTSRKGWILVHRHTYTGSLISSPTLILFRAAKLQRLLSTPCQLGRSRSIERV